MENDDDSNAFNHIHHHHHKIDFLDENSLYEGGGVNWEQESNEQKIDETKEKSSNFEIK